MNDEGVRIRRYPEINRISDTVSPDITVPWRKDNRSIRNLSRVLLKAANAEHVVRVSVQELADRAGIKSKDTAYICLKLLEMAGWIARRKRYGAEEGRKGLLPFEILLLPPIFNKEASQAAPPAKAGGKRRPARR